MVLEGAGEGKQYFFKLSENGDCIVIFFSEVFIHLPDSASIVTGTVSEAKNIGRDGVEHKWAFLST